MPLSRTDSDAELLRTHTTAIQRHNKVKEPAKQALLGMMPEDGHRARLLITTHPWTGGEHNANLRPLALER